MGNRIGVYGVVGVVVMAVVGMVAGCAASSDKDNSYSSIADKLAKYSKTVADEAEVPAVAIGIITEEGLVEERFIGSNNAGDPVTAETMFEIGSASKAFLGVTEAILVDQGDLDWNDRVIDHYPDFKMHDPWATREFRIADLLAQRSGLPEYASQLPYMFGFDWETNVEALKYVEPVSSFRSEFAYQNIPHYVAGKIVADKIGTKTWNEAAKELIFDPLEMSSTITDTDALDQAKDTTRGHTIRDDKAYERPLEDFPSVAEGAGSITSHLSDMSKWIAMHLADGHGPAGKLISAEQLAQTYHGRVPVTDAYFSQLVRHGTDRADIAYATGWFVHSLPEGRIIEHGGNTYGYNSAIMFDPDRKVGLVVLTNQGYQGDVAARMGKYGMDLLQGRSPLDYHKRAQEAEKKVEAEAGNAKSAKKPASEHPISRYEGTYEHPLLGKLAFRADDQKLRTKVGPKGFPATAQRESGHGFTLSWDTNGNPESDPIDVLVEFDEAGKEPDHLTVEGFTFTRSS